MKNQEWQEITSIRIIRAIAVRNNNNNSYNNSNKG